MKTLMTVTSLLLCVAAGTEAQGRGGRQGGPGGGGPAGPLCLNPDDVRNLETRKSTSNTDGVAVGTTVIVITGNPGVGRLLKPCPAGLGDADPLANRFFSPDLIISHQQAIGLTEAQRKTVQTLMVNAQTRFVLSQFKMAAEVEKLQSLIDAPAVDEQKVLDEIDRVLALEREIKREQISLMVRVKNLLTAQQQDILAKLRADD